jgi:hypothetical protein
MDFELEDKDLALSARVFVNLDTLKEIVKLLTEEATESITKERSNNFQN